MVKIILWIGFFVSVGHGGQAQTREEWFQQKQTQKKYLLQQIAALQVYLNYAKKGYAIAEKGINTVRHIKNGDFNLHREFFTSLEKVNPAIEKYATVAGIITYQMKIIQDARQALRNAQESGQLTTEELRYCKGVFDFLLSDCAENIEALMRVVTSGHLQMKDDERIKRIDSLYADMQKKYAFCSSFRQEMGLLSVQRLGEQTESNRSKSVNGIK